MPEIKIVIGANYGDEGKGLASRYFTLQALSQGKKCLNVLFNGGCQRGHTVDLTDGKRYVVHHVGAGFLDGADTYFDKDFIINPIMLRQEMRAYRDDNDAIGSYWLYADKNCRVSTPYDALINQIVEAHRGDQKHGSCGLGIWETACRYTGSSFNLPLSAYLWYDRNVLATYCQRIADIYVPARLATYGITEIPKQFADLIHDKKLITAYLDDVFWMRSRVQCVEHSPITHYDSVVFEGAQGLALDENNKAAYPYVTASSTTPKVPLCRLRGLNPYGHKFSDVEVCYVTRSYFTRHGEGPLPTQCDKANINQHIVDLTNAPNQFQGSIRYGVFDYNEFSRRICKSIFSTQGIVPHRNSIMVTHLNYTGDQFGDCSLDKLRSHTGLNRVYTSSSRYAEEVQCYKERV